mmetsp:Transcript_7813/g.14621  ORF Transcript_7813/g.14621 Transcript_7813/m.14621 type:complete len:119 (-) Transcript_7813:75-431(-)
MSLWLGRIHGCLLSDWHSAFSCTLSLGHLEQPGFSSLENVFQVSDVWVLSALSGVHCGSSDGWISVTITNSVALDVSSAAGLYFCFALVECNRLSRNFFGIWSVALLWFGGSTAVKLI